MLIPLEDELPRQNGYLIMITIFTPTYNRADLLRNLAQSLATQTSHSFEWLVIDDGSTDETIEWLKEYSLSSSFQIRFYAQSNQGKHVAYNAAIDSAAGEFFVCVDSDDVLTENAVKIIEQETKSLNDDCMGLVFPSVNKKGVPEPAWELLNGSRIDIVDLHELYGIMEEVVVFRTQRLKRHRFPVFYSTEGIPEKFCPEGVLYNELIPEGQFKAINSVIYIYEYQPNGLSHRILQLWGDNFNGTMEELHSRFAAVNKYQALPRFFSHFKCIMNVNALCIRKRKNVLKHTPSRLLSALLFLPSVFFLFFRFNRGSVYLYRRIREKVFQGTWLRSRIERY